MSKKGNVSILFLSAAVLLTAGLLVFFVWQNRTKTNPRVPNLVKSSPPSTNSNQPVTSLTPKYIGNYDIVVKINPDSPCNNDIYLHVCLSDIYLKDKKTGQEVFVLTTDNVLRNDARVPVYKSGYIFLVKRTGNDKYPSNDWTDELWVYTSRDQGEKLSSIKGLEFSARPDGLSVAVFQSDISIQVLSVPTGKSSGVYKVTMETCVPNPEQRKEMGDFTFRGWNSTGSELWGDAESEFSVVGCFWSLVLSTGQFTYYPVPPNVGALGALNTEKLVAVYTDKPPMVEAETAKIWLADHPTYSLYLYDLASKRSTKIDTILSAGEFQIIGWDSPTVFRYKTSKGELTYSLNR